MFFRNSSCRVCQTALGYDPDRARLIPLEPLNRGGDLWVPVFGRRPTPRYRRCANLGTAAGCNWLLPEADRAGALCRCCRLTRQLPDLSVDENRLGWGRICQAQRQLLATLIVLGLPAQPLSAARPQGLAFDLLRQLPDDADSVVTGHVGGVITVDVAEADDSQRALRRNLLHEPYRTLLGHLRHQTGHYYWQRLVADTAWVDSWRALFGDERADHAAALQRHYTNGPPVDWSLRHVSAYASSHPREDWAETWAHYLHLVDTLDTARGLGLDGEQVELPYQRWRTEDLQATAERDEVEGFLDLMNGGMALTGALNELSRSLGLADFYPFVLARLALRKLHLVHRIVRQARLAQRMVMPETGANAPAASA